MSSNKSFSISRLSLGDVQVCLNPSSNDGVVSVSQILPLKVRIELKNFTGTLNISMLKQKQNTEESSSSSVSTTMTPTPEERGARTPVPKAPAADVEETPRHSNESHEHRRRRKQIQYEGGSTEFPELELSNRIDSRGSISTTSSFDDNASDDVLMPRLDLMPTETDETLEEDDSAGKNSSEEGADKENKPRVHVEPKLSSSDEPMDGGNPVIQGNKGDNVTSILDSVKKSISFAEETNKDEATSSSMDTMEKVKPSVSEESFPTLLHDACARPNVTLVELESALASDPDAVSLPDARGRLPLHILSENDFLLEHRKGRLVAREFSLQLMDAYMDGITTPDAQGQMPFTSGIRDWVTQSNSTEYMTTGRPVQGDTDPSNHDKAASQQEKSNQDERTSHQKEKSNISNGGATSHRFGDLTFSRQFIPEIDVSPRVEWLFTMLANGLNHVSGKNTREKRKISRRRIRAYRYALSNNVASIPNLLKTVLLVEDNESRSYIMELSIIRRVLLCPASVGPWITWMLRRHGMPSKRAVDYFEILSGVVLKDFMGDYRYPRPEDVENFREEREKVFDVVEEVHDIVPSLTILDNFQIERAAATDVVWKILSDGISRPFVVGIVVVDFVLHVALILGFRSIAIVVEPGPTTYDEPEIVSNEFGFWIIAALCFYFFVRIIGQGLAFLETSTRVFQSYFLNFWNLLDITTIVIAFCANVSIYQGRNKSGLSALTIGLLWLKLLLFLKSINLQLATYILAIIEIVKDIRWFMLIVVIAILMFGEMMRIVTTQTDNGEVCNGDTDLAASDFCTDRYMDSYLRMYTVLLGDFNLHTYRDLASITTLFILFTLLGFIVLLNVLIAVVGDSYEKSRISSRHLFGRARVGFLAEHLSLERFLHPRFRSFRGIADEEQTRLALCRNILSKLGRWIVLLSLVGSAILSWIFLIGGIASLIRNDGDMLMIVFAILLTTLLLAAWVVLASFVFSHWMDALAAPRAKRVADTANAVMMRAIRIVSVGVFGAGAYDSQPSDSIESQPDEWEGKLNYLSTAIRSIVSKAERNVHSAVKSSERRLKDHESLLAKDLASEIGEKLERRHSSDPLPHTLNTI